VPPRQDVNPYIAGSAIKSAEMFFGRDDVFDFIRQNLVGPHSNNPLVLYGQRRTGKTSVLYQLHRRLGTGYWCVFIDLHGLNLGSMSNLMRGIANAISANLRRDHQVTVEVPNQAVFEADPAAAFETMFLGHVLAVLGDNQLILMLDEAIRLDEEVRAGRLDHKTFEFLRHLMQHSQRLNFIFALGTGIEEMAKDYALLFNGSLYHRISFLKPQAARELIIRPAHERYEVTDQAADMIVKITSGHPYYTQLVCHCLFDAWVQSPGAIIGADDVGSVLAEAIELGSANLTYVWQDSTKEEQAFMAGLVAVMGDGGTAATAGEIHEAWRQMDVDLPPQAITRAVRGLIAREVITGSNAYSFTVDLQRLWIEKHRRIDWVKDELAAAIAEWTGSTAVTASRPGASAAPSVPLTDLGAGWAAAKDSPAVPDTATVNQDPPVTVARQASRGDDAGGTPGGPGDLIAAVPDEVPAQRPAAAQLYGQLARRPSARRPTLRSRLLVGLASGGAACVAVLLIVRLAVWFVDRPAVYVPQSQSPGSSDVLPASGVAVSGTQIAVLKDPMGYQIDDAAFSSDGKTVAASFGSPNGDSGHIDIWGSAGGPLKKLLTDPGRGSIPAGIAFSPTNPSSLAVADQEGIFLWNLATDRVQAYDDNDSETETLTDVAYTRDGNTVVAGDFDGDVYLLDLANGQWIGNVFRDFVAYNRQVGPNAIYVTQVAVSPNGAFVAVADSAGDVYVWKVSGGSPVLFTGEVTNSINTLAFSPNGKTLAIVGNASIQLLDLTTRKISSLTGINVPPQAVAFTPDGTTLVVGDNNGKIHLWDLAAQTDEVVSTPITGLGGMAFSPNGRTLAIFGSYSSMIYLYDIRYSTLP
jgi:hypothetical protein